MSVGTIVKKVRVFSRSLSILRVLKKSDQPDPTRTGSVGL